MSHIDIDIKEFFNADNSVNKAKVDELVERIPPQHRDRDHLDDTIGHEIDEAVESGDITNQQANELKQVFGI